MRSLQFLVVCCAIQKIGSFALNFPKNLKVGHTAAIAESGKTLVTGSSILWLGCFLFVSLSGAIWVWLGANSRKTQNLSKVACENFPKLDNDQRGAKSPIRNVGPQRTHRYLIPNKILGSAGESVDEHIMITSQGRNQPENCSNV